MKHLDQTTKVEFIGTAQEIINWLSVAPQGAEYFVTFKTVRQPICGDSCPDSSVDQNRPT